MTVNGNRLRITAARCIDRGNLLAVIDVQFGGLEIRDLKVVRGPRGVFVGMPARPKVDQIGRQLRDEAGKPLWDGPLVRWVDAGTAQNFQQACLAVLRHDYPGIFKFTDAAAETQLPALADLWARGRDQ
jgi:hypothetical protein